MIFLKRYCSFKIIIFFLNLSYTISYTYNVTVYFTQFKEFEVYNGKLKLGIFGKNFSEHVYLSKE